MQKLLIIEDDRQVIDLIALLLGNDADIKQAESLAQGRKILASGPIDLILLDVGLPDGSGFHFLSELKNHLDWREIPVVMLTGLGKVDDKVLGFSLGADDYIAKPFDPAEFRARVLSKLNKRQRSEQREEIRTFADLIFKIPYQRAYIRTASGEQHLDLTPVEYRILLFLLSHPEQVFSRDQIMDEVWPDQVFVSDRTVDTHVSNLRKKITESRYLIRSVHGVGYRIEENEKKKQKNVSGQRSVASRTLGAANTGAVFT